MPRVIMRVHAASGAWRLENPKMKTIDLRRKATPMHHPRCQLSDILMRQGTRKQVPNTAKMNKF